METRRVTIRILGTEGVGKTSLLELLGKFAARSGAEGEIPGGCRISMKGVVLDMLETHFSDLDSGAAEADMWYLVVGADDGPLDIDELLRGRNMRFDGVFFNKFDLLGYDDELIELAMIETRRMFYETGVPDEGYSVFVGSVLDAAGGQVAAGISALEELLKDIVSRL